MTTPLTFQYTGDGFTPIGRTQSACDAQFVIGARYVMAEVEARSMASHAHYFAQVNDAWQNLPDGEVLKYPSADHLRKAALVRSGFATSMTAVCESPKAARKFAIDARKQDAFAIVDLSENVVTLWTAESQSMKAMGKERFQKSKDAVLNWIGQHYGYEPEQLGRAA